MYMYMFYCFRIYIYIYMYVSMPISEHGACVWTCVCAYNTSMSVIDRKGATPSTTHSHE